MNTRKIALIALLTTGCSGFPMTPVAHTTPLIQEACTAVYKPMADLKSLLATPDTGQAWLLAYARDLSAVVDALSIDTTDAVTVEVAHDAQTFGGDVAGLELAQANGTDTAPWIAKGQRDVVTINASVGRLRAACS